MDYGKRGGAETQMLLAFRLLQKEKYSFYMVGEVKRRGLKDFFQMPIAALGAWGGKGAIFCSTAKDRRTELLKGFLKKVLPSTKQWEKGMFLV